MQRSREPFFPSTIAYNIIVIQTTLKGVIVIRAKSTTIAQKNRQVPLLFLYLES